MHRFFISDLPIDSNRVVLSDTAIVHQIGHVLRMREGDTITLFCGDGKDYIAILTAFSRDSVTARIDRIETNRADPDIPITLIQSLPNKPEKLEYLLQKGVETGVSRFVFFESERSQGVRIDDRRMNRYRAIVREAVEQSARNHLPEVSLYRDFPASLAMGRVLVCHGYDGGIPIVSIDSIWVSDGYTIIVGPEGGFTPNELTRFTELGYMTVSFGPRVLRTETTGSVVTFLLLQMREWIR